MSWTLTSPFAERDGVLPFYIDWGQASSPAPSLPVRLRLISMTLVHPEPGRIRSVLDALGEADAAVAYGPSARLEVVLQ